MAALLAPADVTTATRAVSTISISTTPPPAAMTADELVAEAIRCIITGRAFPEHLRARSDISPGLESVQDRIARILAGPVGF